MPRRTAAPIGGSTRQQPLATPQRQPRMSNRVSPDNGMTVQLGGINLVVGGNREDIKIEVGHHDNGRMINSGPNNLGTLKEDKIGHPNLGLPDQRMEILVLNNNGERGFKPSTARLESASTGPTMVATLSGWLAESTSWTTITVHECSSILGGTTTSATTTTGTDA